MILVKSLKFFSLFVFVQKILRNAVWVCSWLAQVRESGQGKNFFKVREKSGNVMLSQIKFKSWKEDREKGNFNRVFFIYVHNVHTVHEIEQQADVGFSRKSVLFAHIVKELSIFMYTACDLLKVLINAVRRRSSPFLRTKL